MMKKSSSTKKLILISVQCALRKNNKMDKLLTFIGVAECYAVSSLRVQVSFRSSSVRPAVRSHDNSKQIALSTSFVVQIF